MLPELSSRATVSFLPSGGRRHVARVALCESLGAILPHYIFDVHDDGPAEWGETSHACQNRDEIEHYVRQLVDEAHVRQDTRGSGAVLTTVFVHHEGNGIVLIAYARPGQDVRFNWTPG